MTDMGLAVQRYMSRGWAVIALYGVREDGSCTCGRPDCGSAGKHPIGNDWGSRVIDSPADIPAGANIGLKTGLASGVFALDVDPKNGGDVRLAELEAEHGALPPTWTQQTGSGGHHYVFTLPDDFTPTNSRGRLPVGLDIRGEGGQIVLAPSVSGVGPYECWVDCVALPGPSWLLELIRPLAPVAVPEGAESAFVPEQATDRAAAYAQGGITALLGEVRSAWPGTRDQTAFNVACRLIEFANADWSAVSRDDVETWYLTAGSAIVAPDFTEGELRKCWRSAVKEVRDRAAVLPPPPGGLPVGGGWDYLGGPPVVPPFSVNGSNGNTAPPVPDPFDNALPTGPVYSPSVDSVPNGAPPTPTRGEGLRAFLLPRSQIGRIPRPVALIRGTLWRDTDAWLIGASGSGKSFVALDWAAHVATGLSWNSQRTAQGRVLYVAAEGAAGIQQRLDAWDQARRLAADEASRTTGERVEPVLIPDDLVILPVPVQVVVRAGRAIAPHPNWIELASIAAEMRPVLIVLDTQARISLGLNENDNAEMGQMIEAVGMLRRAAGGACVLVVHHTGRAGGDARGASAIDGAQDVEWKVERTTGSMSGMLIMDKNKNGADGQRHRFVLRSQFLGHDEEGERVTSLTVDYGPFDMGDSDDGKMDYERNINLRQAELLRVIQEFGAPQGDTNLQLHTKVVRWCEQKAVAGQVTNLATVSRKPIDAPTVLKLLMEAGKGVKGLVGAGAVAFIPGAAPRYAEPIRYEKYQNGELSPDPE